MNTLNPYIKQYKKNQIETATPEQVLILLYDGAIQYLNKAKLALEQENGDQFQSNLLGCEKILVEFMDTLDMERGGKLAENLFSLYDYLYQTLIKAGISRNEDNINEVLKHLMGLRETWQKAIEISNSEKEAKLIDDDERNKTSSYKDYYEEDGNNDETEENDEDEDEDLE